jgi:uncharacterized damage-inducible protein DinB
VQPEGELRTVGLLLYHIIAAESWHAQRMLGSNEISLPEADKLTGDVERLLAWGDEVRQNLRSVLETPGRDIRQVRVFGQNRLSDRKTFIFLIFHEARHMAQIALAVRNSGLQPPGRHDLFFSAALE